MLWLWLRLWLALVTSHWSLSKWRRSARLLDSGDRARGRELAWHYHSLPTRSQKRGKGLSLHKLCCLTSLTKEVIIIYRPQGTIHSSPIVRSTFSWRLDILPCFASYPRPRVQMKRTIWEQEAPTIIIIQKHEDQNVAVTPTGRGSKLEFFTWTFLFLLVICSEVCLLLVAECSIVLFPVMSANCRLNDHNKTDTTLFV